MRPRPVVAIDGPAGAGKSTVARRLADALGYTLVDTGALYRAVALAAQRAGVDWGDGEAVGEVARGLVERRELALGRSEQGAVRVTLGDEDVSEAIRTADMGMGASRVSAAPAVRAALLDLQRQAGEAGGVVLEGRDIGTVVFPDAEVKVFLTAGVEVRGKRRYDELRARGQDADLAKIVSEIAERDAQDAGRAVAPLRPADDAIVLDSSALPLAEVVEQLVALVHQRSAQ